MQESSQELEVTKTQGIIFFSVDIKITNCIDMYVYFRFKKKSMSGWQDSVELVKSGNLTISEKVRNFNTTRKNKEFLSEKKKTEISMYSGFIFIQGLRINFSFKNQRNLKR